MSPGKVFAFLSCWFDLPCTIKVFNDLAGITTLRVQNTAVRTLLLSGFEQSIDIRRVGTGGTADKNGRGSGIVIGNSTRKGGIVFGSLQNV